MDFVTVVGNNSVLNEKDLNEALVLVETKLAEAKDYDYQLRAKILEAMMKTGVMSAKLPNFTLSVVMPKDKMTFNTEKFLEEQSQDILQVFCVINTNETFDLEKFKAENPEVYKKYTTSTDEVTVDTDKLKKMLPSIFDKYATYEKNEDGKTTLRIVKARKK